MTNDQLIERLNRHLADASLLVAEAKAWHWSVFGTDFTSLHDLFEAQATAARTAAYELAERVVQLGGVPAAFPEEWLELTRLDVPTSRSTPPAQEMLRHFASNLDRIADVVSSDVKGVDPATETILADWLRTVEKNRWMVRATLRQ